MDEVALTRLKYPNGPFERPKNIDEDLIQQFTATIESFPPKVRKETKGLSEEQLAWQYRPEGWNIRQVVNHCSDSHMNAVMRFKLALTEDNPTIKPYQEDLWAGLSDTREAPIEYALNLLDGLHARWAILLKSMKPEDFQKTFFHPEHQKTFDLGAHLALYAWHCEHHLEHIRQAKRFKGSFEDE